MAIPLLRFFFGTAKKGTKPPFTVLCPVELPERFPPLWEVAPSVVGRCRPAFSERRPKPVLLPGSFYVPLRHRLSDLSRFHRLINIKLWQRKLLPLPWSYHLKCEVSRLNSWGPGVKKSDCNLQSGFSNIIPFVFAGSQAVRSFGKTGHRTAALAHQHLISLRQPVFRENVTAPCILSSIRLCARIRLG